MTGPLGVASIDERERFVNVLASLDGLAQLYARKGPFATAYLDATRATENGAREVETRWAEVRAQLEAAGADAATVDAVADAVRADVGTPGRHGLVVVAAAGEALLTEVLHEAPTRSSGSFSPLPRLLPYLAQRTTDLPHVVVVADRTGADLYAVGPEGQQHHTVEGGASYPVHRTAADVWNERHFQHRVENTWESNAQDVADAVSRQLAAGPAKLVVVAGDVRARHLIADALGTPPGITAWVGPGLTEFGMDDAEAAATGVTSVRHDRLDAALVRAAVGTNARLVITPGGHGYLPEGIGALLRFQTG